MNSKICGTVLGYIKKSELQLEWDKVGDYPDSKLLKGAIGTSEELPTCHECSTGIHLNSCGQYIV